MLTSRRSVSDVPEEPPSSVMSDHDWRQARTRTSAAVARLLAFVLERAPVAVLCDDVHWADDASLDVLDELSARLCDTRLFVLCTARPELYERRPHWGEGRDGHLRIDLSQLARRHLEEMVRDRLRPVRGLPAETIATVVDRAAGNPLVLCELLHLLVDSGIIERKSPDDWMLHAERIGELKLPGTIQGIMQARLDALPSDELVLASVVGDTFWEGVLDRLRAAIPVLHPESPVASGAGGSSTPSLLQKLRDRQLVRAREGSSVSGDREYVFAERAMCEVAYETLSRKARRTYHGVVADWCAQHERPDAASALLAHHLDGAGRVAQAVSCHAHAAAHAASFGQNAEALRHYARAARLMEDSRDDYDDDSSVEAIEERRVVAWQDRVRILAEYADVLRRLGRLDEAQAVLHTARGAIVREERRPSSSRGPVDELAPARWEARVDWGLALTMKTRGDNDATLGLVTKAIAGMRAAQSAADLPVAYELLAWTYSRMGNFAASRVAALEGLGVCRTIPVHDLRWRAGVAQLLIALGAVFYRRQELVRAERCYLQAARVVDETTNPRVLSFALNDVAVVRYERGDIAGARKLFARSLALKEREGDLHQIAIAMSNLAEVELRAGQADAALKYAKRSVRLAEQAGAISDLPDITRNLAEAWLALDNPEAALAAAEKAVQLAMLPGGRVYLERNVEAQIRIVRAIVSGGGPDRIVAAKQSVARTLSWLAECGSGNPLETEKCSAMLKGALD
jgi:tetratricopeptide (TPR) repeat protein